MDVNHVKNRILFLEGKKGLTDSEVWARSKAVFGPDVFGKKFSEFLSVVIHRITFRRLLLAETPIETLQRSYINDQGILVELASHAYWEDVFDLVERGISVNEKNKLGESPLSYAVVWGDSRSVEKLFHLGADPCTTVGLEESLLIMEAAASGTGQVLLSFLNYGTGFDQAKLIETCVQNYRFDQLKMLLALERVSVEHRAGIESALRLIDDAIAIKASVGRVNHPPSS